MGVLVCYDDFTYDVINDYHLEYLLDKGCIVGFDNSGDWVKNEGESQEGGLPAGQTKGVPKVPRQRKRYLIRK